MVDYDFYVNSYMGSTVPEKAFSGMAARAAEYLQKFRRLYRISDGGQTAQDMAICAMAEQLYAAGKYRSGISSASVGSVSVHYGGGDIHKSLDRELLKSAGIYLDIRRGVS